MLTLSTLYPRGWWLFRSWYVAVGEKHCVNVFHSLMNVNASYLQFFNTVNCMLSCKCANAKQLHDVSCAKIKKGEPLEWGNMQALTCKDWRNDKIVSSWEPPENKLHVFSKRWNILVTQKNIHTHTHTHMYPNIYIKGGITQISTATPMNMFMTVNIVTNKCTQ